MDDIALHSQPPLSQFLHDELMIDILSRLPVKSLVRFRCLSKSFNFLIFHDPQFVKLHLKRAPKNTNLLLNLAELPTNDWRYDEVKYWGSVLCCSKQSLLDNKDAYDASSFDPVDGCYRVKYGYDSVGSCNGLVCFIKTQSTGPYSTQCRARFWNPALRLSSKKSPPLRLYNPIEYHAKCGTQKKKEYHAKCGFGYDSSNDSYKVVALVLSLETVVVKVHSMGDNCWREILSFPVFPLLPDSEGQYLNGTLNWFALRRSGSYCNWNTVNTVDLLVILSIDLSTETYKHLLLPALDELPKYEPTLEVLWECLCFFHHGRETHFVIWQMKEFGNEKSWTSDEHWLSTSSNAHQQQHWPYCRLSTFSTMHV